MDDLTNDHAAVREAMSDSDSDDFRVISISKGTAQDLHVAAVQTRNTRIQNAGNSTGQKGPRSDVDSRPDSQNAEAADMREGGISNSTLNDWVQSAISMQKSGLRFTEMVRKNKNFRNPAIFEKMISYCNIDDFGTELPVDPPLQEHEYYEAIADFQEVCMRESL